MRSGEHVFNAPNWFSRFAASDHATALRKIVERCGSDEKTCDGGESNSRFHGHNVGS